MKRNQDNQDNRDNQDNQNNKKSKKFKMSLHKYYEYKDDDVRCECGWRGKGFVAVSGDLIDYSFFLDCPQCHKENIAAVSMPTFDEVEEFGSEKDKERVRKRKEILKKLDEGTIKSEDPLPDIEEDNIVLVWDQVLEEEEDGKEYERFTVITHNGKEIWRQPVAYEGYYGFGEFCRFAKKKYGSKLVDVQPTRRSELYLYGDLWSSVDYVKRVRESLKNEDD